MARATNAGDFLMQTPQEESGLIASATARAENELLLLCAHTKISDASAARIKALTSRGLDWDYLFLLAQRHAVLPLLHRQLSLCAVELLPRDFRKRLSAKFRENATRNLLLSGELLRIVRLFESESIPTLAYKGPALAAMAYGDISLRRFIDLDIIVGKRDVRRARVLLCKLGFELTGNLTRSQQELLLRTQHNMAFTRDGGKLIVEVHWDVASKQFASIPIVESVWERAATVALKGGEVKSLSPEDLLIALCVHGTKHLWERLAWICDVSELVRSQTHLDWTYILLQARHSHVERMLFIGLRLANVLLGAQLPEVVRKELFDDKVTARLSSLVVAGLFRSEEYEPAGLFGSLTFNLRARRRLQEKLKYIQFIFKPTDGDLVSVKLPRGLNFAYYLLRPIRLLMKGNEGH